MLKMEDKHDDAMLQQTTCDLQYETESIDVGSQPDSTARSGVPSRFGQRHEQCSPVAWEIESRVVAGQTDEQLADQIQQAWDKIKEMR